ncbi:MAG: phosphoglucosamine mutase [Candidatus Omnitrophica bacterium]|nr:phosphoglucosamine mutase [Candidatus Omnitrophota bacterium]
MSSLMISVAGVRGVVGESLTPEIALNFGMAFGTYLKSGKVIIGRDSRVSGPLIQYALLSGLTASGCSVVDLGIAATPTCSLMIKETGAKAGVVISASHNPIQWNGLKFFDKEGLYLSPDEMENLLKIYNAKKFKMVRWNELKSAESVSSSGETHLDKIISQIDIKSIRKRKFKVVLDACNGAGAVHTPRLLERLGCSVIRLNCEPNGLFAHPPEPLPANLGELASFVRKSRADIGFAQDADADRLAIISDKGQAIGEEYTLALVSRFILSRKKGPLVANLSTSRMLDDIANEAGCKVYRSKVGEFHVSKRMKEVKAVIGGEGNGGVIDPRVHYLRDSLVAIALILQYMAEAGMRISMLAEELPKYYMIKKKVEYKKDNLPAIFKRLQDKYSRQRVDFTDGVRIDWKDSWVQLRPSGTEPVLRVMSEAPTEEEADTLCQDIMKEVKLCAG